MSLYTNRFSKSIAVVEYSIMFYPLLSLVDRVAEQIHSTWPTIFICLVY
jgi:hypothetical protein